MTGHIDITAFDRMWADDIALFIRRSEGGKRFLGVGVTFEERPEGSYDPQPTVAIGRSEAQMLMDQLWNCGLRPTQGRQSEGAMAAQGKHLEDMRALAFAKLNVPQPAARA